MAGLTTFTLPVPWLADLYGRRILYGINLILFTIFLLAIILATQLEALYVLIFMIGGTMPGRTIVGLNYILEFTQIKYRDTIVFVRMLAG